MRGMFRRPVADLHCHPLFPLYHIASDCQLIKNGQRSLLLHLVISLSRNNKWDNLAECHAERLI